MHITLDADDLLRRLQPSNIEAAINRGGDKAAAHLESKVKQRITGFTRTGRLRSSVAWRRSGRWRWSIGTDVSYARPVEDGSRPHIIRPRNKKVLRFRIGNRTIFAREVHHPGFAGHHYMRNTLDAERGEVVRIFRETLADAINPR